MLPKILFVSYPGGMSSGASSFYTWYILHWSLILEMNLK